eukprot:TRINITY_DN11413_c0_g1_i1.p1 TRINITY_DN11413_c0_g1~~TRINITY_DN11413_c0_g1_i1.p1  ORF type:complete len:376 (-),score=72.96 TRINITY_DN11413_c0_g1_i1:51-1178(-)
MSTTQSTNMDVEAGLPKPPPGGGGGTPKLPSLSLLALDKLPAVSKYIAGILLLTNALAFMFPRATFEILGLVPAYTFSSPFYVWNLVTCSFVDSFILNTLIAVRVVIGAGLYLEPRWGAREYCQFVLFVATASALICYLFALALWKAGDIGSAEGVDGAEGEETLTARRFDSIGPYHGSFALVSGFAVVYKQLAPDAPARLFNILPYRAKLVPLFLLVVEVALLTFVDTNDMQLGVAGLFTSWFYLRFIQTQADGSRGDKSGALCLTSFLPDPIQSRLSDAGYGTDPSLITTSTSLALTYTAASDGDGTGGGGSSGLGAGANRSESADASRRRAKALQAVEHRMAETEREASRGGGGGGDVIGGGDGGVGGGSDG